MENDDKYMTGSSSKTRRPSFLEVLSSISKAGSMQESSFTSKDKLQVLMTITEGIRLQVEEFHQNGGDLVNFTLSKAASAKLINTAVGKHPWSEKKLDESKKFAKESLKRQIQFIQAFPVLKSVEIYRDELEAEISQGMNS